MGKSGTCAAGITQLSAVVEAEHQRTNRPRVRSRGDNTGNDQLLPARALCFDPIVPAARAIGCVRDFRDNALQAQLAGVAEQRGTRFGQGLAEPQRIRSTMEEAGQCIFPPGQRQVSQVSAIEMQKIERIEFHAIMTVIFEVLLQQRKT